MSHNHSNLSSADLYSTEFLLKENDVPRLAHESQAVDTIVKISVYFM